MVEVIVTGALVAGGAAILGRRQLQTPRISGVPGAGSRGGEAPSDLPCPWCMAATNESDSHCPSCHQPFG